MRITENPGMKNVTVALIFSLELFIDVVIVIVVLVNHFTYTTTFVNVLSISSPCDFIFLDV